MRFFEDMLSSHRGAGFIGTLIAVGIFIALGSLFILVSDEDFQGGGKTIESEIRDQKAQIEQLGVTIENYKKSIIAGKENQKSGEQFESLSRQIKPRQERITAAQEQIVTYNKEIEQLYQNWEKYKTAYRADIRAKTIGAKYPALVTKSGRTYTNATIRKIDNVRITVSHEQGSGSITWNDLPDEIIDLLQFTQELADAQIKSESSAAQHFSDAATTSGLKEAIASLEEKIKDANALFQSKQLAASNGPQIIMRAEADIQRLQQMIAAEQNKEGLRQTPRYRSQVLENEKTIEKEREKSAEFARFQVSHREQMAELERQLAELKDKLAKAGK